MLDIIRSKTNLITLSPKKSNKSNKFVSNNIVANDKTKNL